MATRDLPIAIVGAGFSGLGMAIALKQAGLDDFIVFEAGDRVGGTWRVNTYPGCACDIPSQLYSYSFERNPGWSRSFSPQPEILDYLEHCATKYGVNPHIRFNTRVNRATYDEERQLWVLETSDGQTTEARLVVSAPGPLAVPVYPNIEDLERFEGPMFHSAQWDHDVDLSGKRVAVIGTGASAIQVVPAIAPKVGELHLFQRTAPWVLRKPDGPISERTRELFARFPALTLLNRSLLYGIIESLGAAFFLEPRLMGIREAIAKRRLERLVEDPELRRKVTPQYRMGCKRILFSNEYYQALTRDNVEVHTDPIKRLTSDAVVTRSGRVIGVDAIVLCTGFDPLGAATSYEIVGKRGRTLGEQWKQDPEAYYGIAVAGFPNFFSIMGPNTGLGHNSIVFMIEAQVHYILQCIRLLNKGKHAALEVRSAALRKFNDRLQARMNNVVWSTGCNSWYLDETGRNFALWPGSTVEYWLRTRRVDKRAYEPG